jgi:hypothetical protein
MTRRLLIPGGGSVGLSGIALMAAAAAMIGETIPMQVARPVEQRFPSPPRKSKRHKPADRSKKKYMLKGCRP